METNQEDRQWKVYKHTNMINGKVYIGQTKKENPEKRWGKNGEKYKDSKYFWNAIQKYSWDNFAHEIVKSNLTKNEADDLERELIQQYRSSEREYGYNISKGGQGPNGIKLSPDQIERAVSKKRKPVMQFDLNMNFLAEYPSCTEAAKATGGSVSGISNCAKGNGLTAYGYAWCYSDQLNKINKDEYLKRIDEASNKQIPVIQFTKDMVYVNRFNSIHQAARECGLFYNDIQLAIKQDNSICGGYIWISEDNYSRMLTNEIPMRKPYHNSSYKPICQFSSDMKFINEFSCIAEASRHTGANDGEISKCALGKVSHAKHFIWIYKNDYTKMLNGEIPMRKPLQSKKR